MRGRWRKRVRISRRPFGLERVSRFGPGAVGLAPFDQLPRHQGSRNDLEEISVSIFASDEQYQDAFSQQCSQAKTGVLACRSDEHADAAQVQPLAAGYVAPD